MLSPANAFKSADILLPKTEETDMTKWACVACDQFTSQPEYWEDAYRIAGDAPSALKLILPEAYLESPDADRITEDIHSRMRSYLESGIFKEYKDALIYTERTDSTGKIRRGLVGAVDLEQYDYRRGSTSPVRATEATVAERIPPRLKVRRGAALELPHIMILIDDPQKTVIEKLSEEKDSFEKLYDFELMKGGGSIKGYLVPREKMCEIFEALERLGSKESFEERSGVKDVPVLLYAMGDGNHSLATAKEHYEELKREQGTENTAHHPARYALAELVNLHSEALEFEAIHRLLEDIDTDGLIAGMTEALGLANDDSSGTSQSFEWLCSGVKRKYYITKPLSNLTVGSVQSFLDGYLREKGGRIDYIHGADTLARLSAKEGAAGIILPDMAKEELFPTVIKDGALPRKTFSMGHAEDKRYYVEARKIER